MVGVGEEEKIEIIFLEVKLHYDIVCRSVGLSFSHNFLNKKARKFHFHFHAPIA